MSDNEQEQSATKNQHYVPKFYLKRFVNKDDKLEILDCEHRRIGKPRSPKSVCSEVYFYSVNDEYDEVSQEIENEFQRFESSIAKHYDEVADRFASFQEIRTSDKLLVATFMSMLYLRGPYMRKQINRMNADMIKQITKMRYSSPSIYEEIDEIAKEEGLNLTDKDKQEVIDFAVSGDYDVVTNNASHLRFLGEMDGFRNLLFHKHWLVYVSKSSKKFITSDNPVIELFPDWTGKFFYGPSFLQRTHCFAMRPDIYIIAMYPHDDVGNKVKRKTLFDNPKDNDKILELNFNHPRNANAFAYASDTNSLQDIVDSANLFDKQSMRKLIGFR